VSTTAPVFWLAHRFRKAVQLPMGFLLALFGTPLYL
jgi:hypothetical protein